MIKYIGSKRKLLPHIMALVQAVPGLATAADLFAGTTRVSQALKASGLHVHANDRSAYGEVLATCYIEADADAVDHAHVQGLLDHLAGLPGVDGYVTETFCQRARYFQPHNGRRIDAIRTEIAALALDRIERAIVLTSLIEAADRVDSTTGVQMAYLKHWSKRSHNDLELRLPVLLPGSGTATGLDANALAPKLTVDLAYLDPPYNQHAYHGNYHVWETIVRGDEPEAYGVAMKRTDVRTSRSAYNSRPNALPAFADLVTNLDARFLLVSFNDEGHITPQQMRDVLTARGEVGELTIAHDRYVGARIGIHSPSGAKVGAVGHLRNTEHLYLVGEGARELCEHVAGVTDSQPACT